MFPSLQCSYRPASMQAIREGNIDCIDGGIVQQFVIAGKDVGNLMFFSECLCTCDVTCSDRCHCDFGNLLSWLNQRRWNDFRSAENTYAHRLHMWFSCSAYALQMFLLFDR